MPQIKLKHIVSFSSEDSAHAADNLLKHETYRKWQCATPGEKQASVIMELEKASEIYSIDIGNNGSAFVEVLAGRSSNASNDFQVLLVASSFMTPAESKSGTNSNRVRMFGHDKLSKGVADQKWDRVKFICTQPYNKTSCYGLSFVNLHSPPEAVVAQPQEKVQSRLGAFLLKDEVTVPMSTGSLFKKRKESVGSSSPTTTAADMREASKTKGDSTVQTKPAINIKDKIRKQELTGEKKNPETQAGTKRTQDSITANYEDNTNPTKVVKEQTCIRPPTKKLKVVSKRDENEVPFHEVLKSVVFVLSGFKNPERGHIRDKALSMGARYRGDWDHSCTHLICAFVNTPKFNQVKGTGKGKIVSKGWVNDSHTKRKRMSEKRYRLNGDDDSEESNSGTEDDEYDDKKQEKHDSTQQLYSSTKPTVSSTDKRIEEERASTSNFGKVSPEPEKPVKKAMSSREHSEDELSSGHDTEDEIRRVMENKDDPYGGSTEDETDIEDETTKQNSGDLHFSTGISRNLLELPEFFSKMFFLLYGEFEPDERRLLTRYITAYSGELVEYMSDNVKFVITYENWDDNFNEALVGNSCLTFVRPKWIYACHEKRSFVPFQPYIVVPR